MTRKTTVLIITLFLITCGLLYFAIQPPLYPKKTAAPSPTPISVNAHTTLSLTPALATESSKTASYTVAVLIDTHENAVNAVQLELSYDPTALTDVSLSSGSFFNQPTALLKNINTDTGRISYALAQQIDLPATQGSGTIALISFNILPSYTGKTVTLSFLPKTAVAADKILESVLKKTTSYTLTLTAPSPLPTGPLYAPTGQ